MLDSDRLAALAEMVADGLLSADQATAVGDALRLQPSVGDPNSAVAPSLPGTATAQPGWRDRLIEAAGYVGGALVGVALAVLLAQSWSHVTRPGRIALLAVAAVLAAAVAQAIVRRTPGGRRAVCAPERAARRRLVNLLLVAGALAATAAIVTLVGPHGHQRLVAASVGLVAVVLVDRYVSSALSEIACFGFATGLVYALGDLARPAPAIAGPSGFAPQPRTAFDLFFPLVVIGFGLLWATVVAGLLRERQLASVLGLALSFIAAAVYLGSSPTRAEGLTTMAALAALGLWRYLVQAQWPWLVFAIATLTAFMFELVGGAGQPVLGFLAAGIVLLALSAFAIWRRGRTAHPLPGD